MAGMIAPGWRPPTPTAPVTPTSQFGNPATFTAAADTQASDYDRIMQSYRDLLSQNQQNPITAQTIAPQITSPNTSEYKQSADVTGSLSNLSDLATTGGYSAGDISDLRARAISPVRSIYANAQQNIDRQKSLQGGYSPNYTAATAKMARDESQQISDAVTNANAGIAQNVAANKLSIAPTYASAAGSANALKTSADKANADILNQVAEANAARVQQAGESNASNNLTAQLNNRNTAMGAVQGQASLYGTTPALTSTFGNQVIQAGQLGQGQQNINLNKQRLGMDTVGTFGRN